MGEACLIAIARHVGVELTSEQLRQFEDFAAWLTTEGVAIGGIGPRESKRVWQRHLCDAVTFGVDLVGRGSLLDVGSGVGLPGIPLAILYPELQVTLVDRAGRRIDALYRLRDVLGLQYEVVQADINDISTIVDRLTFRASLRIQEAISHAARLMAPEGDAWFGLGRGELPQALTEWRTSGEVEMDRSGLTIEERCIGAEILDSPAWLLRMTRP